MLICDKCNGKIIEGSIFCPHCGDPVTQDDKPEDTLAESQVAEVQISFGKSSSINYDRAVQICRNIPTHKEEGEDKSLIHSVTLPITEVELLINLYDLVGSWKTSKMLINGQPSAKSALVYHGVGCYRNRQKAYNQEQYCFGEKEYEFNIWGCTRLNMPINQWGGGWIDYGNLDKSGVWHLDKDRIRHELELKIHENELCPVLNRRRIMETLDKFPDTINPKKDPSWVYQTNYEEIRGEFKEVATGIRPVVKKADQYVLGSFKPKWEVEEIESEIDTDFSSDRVLEITPRGSKKQKSGCFGILIFAIGLPALILMILFIYILK